ncbi:MAG TPA: hypothetical protein VFZ25_17785, partial [Chloroflexota bacterium]|nr:hypothetical protein [Chloroflexota bacterium]
NANTPLGSTAAVVFRTLGIGGFIALLIVQHRARNRTTTAPSPGASRANLFGRRYWQIVVGQIALLAAGYAVIGAIDVPSETYLAWTTFVVGLHFLAFRWAGVWRRNVIRPAVLLVLFGIAGLALAGVAGTDWIPFASGILPGLTLLAGSISIAARDARSPRRDRHRRERDAARLGGRSARG